MRSGRTLSSKAKTAAQTIGFGVAIAEIAVGVF